MSSEVPTPHLAPLTGVEGESFDEFSSYFSGQREPKLLITTSRKVKGKQGLELIADLLTLFPYMTYVKRKENKSLSELSQRAIQEGYTDILVVHVDGKVPTGLLVSHLPEGPTAWFRLSSLRLRSQIKNHGCPTAHPPELILHNFDSHLGRRVARLFASLCPPHPVYRGRQVITLHNNHDFIFFRVHRYIFDTTKKARLQELGPSFTLRLRSLQAGLHDPLHGSYEFEEKTKMHVKWGDTLL